MDRPGRSFPDLLEIVGQLEKRGIGLQSVTETIDTTTSGGKLLFHVFGAMEFERNLIRERTKAGLNAARARDRLRGWPWVLDAPKIALARRLYDERKHTMKEICGLLGITKPCIYDYLGHRHSQRRTVLRSSSEERT